MESHLLLVLLVWSVVSSPAVQAVFSGVAEVTTSGDFRSPGPPGSRCRLPDVINVTISSGDVTISLEVSKPPRVTQDAPVYVIGDDGKIRQVATNNQEVKTHAFYRSLQSKASLRVTCPGTGEQHPIVEGTVSHGGSWYHLRHKSSGVRDVIRLTSSGRGEYQLTEVVVDDVKGGAVDSLAHPGHPSPFPPPSPSTPASEQGERSSKGQGGDNGAARAGRFHRSPHRRPRRRRRRQAVDGNNVFIDAVAVIAFDVYDDAIKASAATTAAEKQADALSTIKDKYALMISEVDLYYGLIGDRLPYSVSVSLARIIIAETAAASPWTEELKTKPDGSSRYQLRSDTSLGVFGSWLRNQTSLENADIFLAYTDYDLIDSFSGVSNLGYAVVGGVCSPTAGGNIATVESLSFGLAVIITVHELGHTFGASHDGQGNTCKASDRYIMAASLPPRSAPNYSQFSSCSLDYFKTTFSSRAATTEGDVCLHEIATPDPGVPDFTGMAPGQLTDAQAQCKNAYGNTSSVCQAFTTIGDSMCGRTLCSDPSLPPGYCNSIALLRGTSCGDKKWCFNNLCVEDPAAPSKDERCLFGNKRDNPYSGDPRTCEDVVAASPSTCYGTVFASLCCGACNAVKVDVPGCEYGDTSTDCDVSLCDAYNETDLFPCCGTCNVTGPTTTPTPTTPILTTPILTTPRVSDGQGGETTLIPTQTQIIGLLLALSILLCYHFTGLTERCMVVLCRSMTWK